MVIACPVIRNQVARELVRRREKGSWLDWVKSQDGNAISQEINTRLWQHYLDEEQNDPGKDPQTYLDRAKADVQADIDAAIDTRHVRRERMARLLC